MTKGFRVTVVDLETGDAEVKEIGLGDYILLVSGDCNLHYRYQNADGTVRLGLTGYAPDRPVKALRPADAPHQARRGTDVEAFIKAFRDRFEGEGASADDPRWDAIDDLLDLYRLRADTGVPLGEEVQEG